MDILFSTWMFFVDVDVFQTIFSMYLAIFILKYNSLVLKSFDLQPQSSKNYCKNALFVHPTGDQTNRPQTSSRARRWEGDQIRQVPSCNRLDQQFSSVGLIVI